MYITFELVLWTTEKKYKKIPFGGFKKKPPQDILRLARGMNFSLLGREMGYGAGSELTVSGKVVAVLQNGEILKVTPDAEGQAYLVNKFT